MSTLADEFLADLGDDSATDPTEEQKLPHKEKVKEEEVDEVTEALIAETLKHDNVNDIVKVFKSEELEQLLEKIRSAMKKSKAPGSTIENDEEYSLIVDANEMAVSISNEIAVVHKFVRDHYSKKFPELESLVLNPLDYARAVKRIQNETDLTTIELSDVLPASNVITISMTASHTSGKPLPKEEMEQVVDACDVALDLEESRRQILQFVETRMQFFAPNLTAIVGSEIAAKLIGTAGGLVALSKVPASNILVFGKKPKHMSGFSSISTHRHVGYVIDCDLVMKYPPELRLRACRLVASKVSLAARVDSFDGDKSGKQGQILRSQMEKTLEKWQEPPPPKQEKPLPAPDDRPKKRRGGRKYRAMKERYAMTELRKRQNRMQFGKVGDEDDNNFRDLGLIGQSGSGRIRLRADDGKGFKTYTKRQRKEFKEMTTSGLATSIYAMTPVQGLELVNPEAQKKKLQEANKNYFSNVGFGNLKDNKV